MGETGGEIESHDNQWIVTIKKEDVPEFQNETGILKIRWIFPPADEPVKIQALSAFSYSDWTIGEFNVEAAPGANQQKVTISAYNGLITTAKDGAASLEQTWDFKTALQLKLLHKRTRQFKRRPYASSLQA